MINLGQIFSNTELYKLPHNYKKSCLTALLTILNDKLGNKNLESLYKILALVPTQEAASYLSTFFYHTIQQKARETDSTLENDFLLFAFAFDSLFDFIENDIIYDVDCPISLNFLLPSIGVNLLLSSNIKSFYKNNNSIILKNDMNAEIPYKLPPKNRTADSLTILDLQENNYLYQKIIKLHATCDLLDSTYWESFSHKFSQAITKLKMFDSKFSYHSQRLEFIIPMAFVAKDITKSFTLSGIPHLLFLSDCDSSIKLMENLIHESLHDELNIFMNYYGLTSAEKNYYYSPWRNDARPIRGLLHAIYVFTGIFNFYHNLLGNPMQMTTEEKTFVMFRYNQIYYELGLAFYQLERSSSELTKLGLSFIGSLKKIYNASTSSYIESVCPMQIRWHLKNWQEINVNDIAYSTSDLFQLKDKLSVE